MVDDEAPRRTADAAVIAHTLIELDPQYPRLGDDALRDLETAKLQLEAEAPSGDTVLPVTPGSAAST